MTIEPRERDLRRARALWARAHHPGSLYSERVAAELRLGRIRKRWALTDDDVAPLVHAAVRVDAWWELVLLGACAQREGVTVELYWPARRGRLTGRGAAPERAADTYDRIARLIGDRAPKLLPGAGLMARLAETSRMNWTCTAAVELSRRLLGIRRSLASSSEPPRERAGGPAHDAHAPPTLDALPVLDLDVVVRDAPRLTGPSQKAGDDVGERPEPVPDVDVPSEPNWYADPWASRWAAAVDLDDVRVARAG